MGMFSAHDAGGCACCGDLLRGVFGTRPGAAGGLGRRALLRGAGGVAAAVVAGAVALPGAAHANTGNYEAMLLTCIDPRFPAPTLAYMQQRGMVGKYSQFSMAGASIGVVAPAFQAWQNTFWDNLAASIQLHRIPRVIALDHRDCGAARIAYGADAVGTPAAETKTHGDALRAFRAEVAKRHPTMAVETCIMALDGRVDIIT